MDDVTWVPRSCTLPAGERPLRVAEWDALFAERLASLSRPLLLRLRLDLADGPGVEERTRDLVARESSCCSFFGFAITPGEGLIHLDISVDAAHAAVLDALAARTASTASAAGEQR